MNFLIVLCKLKVPLLLISVSTTVLLVILISTSNQAFSQSSGGVVSPPQPQLESVKILNLMPFQSVELKKDLVISGESSDTTAKDCSVYVLVNGVQPYQSAVASGTGGATDFSQWKFVLHEKYTHLNEGNNKITAKLVCNSAPTRWYSVVVGGVPNSNISETSPIDTTQQSNVSETSPIDTTQQSNVSETSPIDTTQQSNVSETSPIDTTQQSNVSETSPIDTTQQSNVSETSPIDTTQQSNVSETSPIDTTQQSNVSETSPIDTTQQSNVSETSPIDTTQQSNVSETSPIDTTQQSNVSETSPIDTTQQSNVSETSPIDTTHQSKLLVTILPLKNPLARGDSQNATITVTNSDNRPIANAQIDGKLIYPGNNFEKEFKGSTDLDGKFVYSWTVGKKGDIGPLVMEVEASSQGYPPASANISFELVKSGESSQTENPFQSLQRP